MKDCLVKRQSFCIKGVTKSAIFIATLTAMKTTLLLSFCLLLFNPMLYAKPEIAKERTKESLASEMVRGGLVHHDEAHERLDNPITIENSERRQEFSGETIVNTSRYRQRKVKKKQVRRKWGKRINGKEKRIIGGILIGLGICGVLASGAIAIIGLIARAFGGAAAGAVFFAGAMIGLFLGVAMIVIGIALIVNSR